jgi:hypothetical protein
MPASTSEGKQFQSRMRAGSPVMPRHGDLRPAASGETVSFAANRQMQSPKMTLHTLHTLQLLFVSPS